MRVSGKIQIIRRDGTCGEPCNWHTSQCTIGSSEAKCDIRIVHPSVAPIHCELHLIENGYVLAVSKVNEDYIMLVDNSPLEDWCILSNNSVLTVGERQIRFMYPPGVIMNTSVSEILKKTLSRILKGEEISTSISLPFVYQSKRTASVNRPTTPITHSPRPRSATPKRTLGTSERYGPVPPRQPATPPIIQVLRHEPPTSSQSKIQSSSPTPLDRFTKQSSMEKSRFDNFINTGACKSQKKDHSKFYTASNFPPLTSSTPGGMCSPTYPRSNQGIYSLVSSTPSANHLKSTVMEKNFSPGLNKSLHKQLIVKKSSNLSKLGRTDNPDNASDHIKNQCDTSKISLYDGQKNQSSLNESETFHATENPSECLTESVNSTSTSLRSMKRKLPLNTSKSVNILSVATDLESDYHGNKNGLVIQDENYSDTGEQIATKRKRGVSFGPPLSPEQFDKSLPPSTPVKRGETPITKVNHITPANATFRTNPGLSVRPLTPFPSKSKSTRSQLSVFSENTFNSPSYFTTSNRISAVISLPPTPDTNLLDSVDTNLTCSPGSNIENPVVSATYSAPVKKSSAYQKALKRRRSLNFTGSTDKIPSLRAPPTTPVSMALLSRSTSKANSHISTLEYESLVSPSPRYRSRESENPLLQSPNDIKKDVKTHMLPPQQASNTTTKTKKPRQFIRHSLPVYNVQETISNTTTKHVTLPTRKTPGNTSFQKNRQTSETSSNLQVNSTKDTSSRPSSVPPAVVPEDESATPKKRLSSVSPADVVGLSGVKKLMKTPKAVYTPRVSGVGDLFVDESSSKRGRGRPSSVPPAVVPEDESATPKKRLSSVSPADVVGLSGVKKLMKTPKAVYTPRVSGVGDLFVDESSSKRGRGRPPSVAPAVVPEDESATPKKRSSSVSPADVVGLSGVKKLMKTPKAVYTPRVSGVGDLFVDESSSKRGRGRPPSVAPAVVPEDESATPKKRLSSVSPADVVGLSGVKKLMKTPKAVYTPRVSGVGDLFVDESSSKRGRGRPSSVPPAVVPEDESATPKKRLSSVSPADVVGLSGVKKLMKTPKAVYTPRVSGVGDLFVDESSSKRGRGRPPSVAPAVVPEDESATPKKRLSSVSPADVVGLSGVKKLMKTPKAVYTPRVSGVGDLFVDESSSKRGRGRPPSVAPAVVPEDESATPKKRLSSVSPADVVGLSGVKKLMKTPKAVYTPRVSGVGDLFVDESSSKRGRGRPSSVPPAVVPEDESATPKKRLSSVSPADVVGLSGVKKLMKTPKAVYTPRVSGVGDLFVDESSSKRGRGRPPSVAPAVVPEDESATPKKRLSSVSPADVVGLSGVKKLMKTPKAVYTPRVSGVGDLFVDESSSKRGRGRPPSVAPAVVPEDESATPKKRLSSVSPADVVGLSGVKKLMKTPKAVYTPRVSGVGDLFVDESSSKRGRGRPPSVAPAVVPEDESATPKKRSSSVSPADVVGLSGVKKLMKTPKAVYTPRVSGVGDLFVDESSSKRGRGRPSSVPPAVVPEDESATPKKRLSSVSPADVVGLSGVKKLMKTPKAVYTPRVSGVGDLFVDESSSKRGRGRPPSVAPAVVPEDESATPKKRSSSVSPADVVGLSGVKKLMKTPKAVYTPRVSGVGDLFVDESSSKRGRGRPPSVAPAVVPEDESATPKKRSSSVSPADVVGLSGVKKLMKTPKAVYTPRVSGVGDLFVDESSSKRGRGRPPSVAPAVVPEDESATPKKRSSSVSPADVVGLSGVKKLMKTPKAVYTPRVSGVGDLFVDESSSKRGRGRPSSVAPAVVPEDESATPKKRSSSVSPADVVGLSGVKKLMKTPKAVYTPRVSGVGDLFVDESSSKRGRGRPSSVPPAVVPEDESATPKKRLSSVSPADVVGLSGVKKLMKTPKAVYTPRVSGVGDLFVDESSSKRGRGRPSSVAPAVVPEDESATPKKCLVSLVKLKVGVSARGPTLRSGEGVGRSVVTGVLDGKVKANSDAMAKAFGSKRKAPGNSAFAVISGKETPTETTEPPAKLVMRGRKAETNSVVSVNEGQETPTETTASPAKPLRRRRKVETNSVVSVNKGQKTLTEITESPGERVTRRRNVETNSVVSVNKGQKTRTERTESPGERVTRRRKVETNSVVSVNKGQKTRTERTESPGERATRRRNVETNSVVSVNEGQKTRTEITEAVAKASTRKRKAETHSAVAVIKLQKTPTETSESPAKPLTTRRKVETNSVVSVNKGQKTRTERTESPGERVTRRRNVETNSVVSVNKGQKTRTERTESPGERVTRRRNVETNSVVSVNEGQKTRTERTESPGERVTRRRNVETNSVVSVNEGQKTRTERTESPGERVTRRRNVETNSVVSVNKGQKTRTERTESPGERATRRRKVETNSVVSVNKGQKTPSEITESAAKASTRKRKAETNSAVAVNKKQKKLPDTVKSAIPVRITRSRS
ncbi:unnamed protein product [Trichobilharzia szidati]|nr:unnamed protein product [Trichobilharzia szidati]